MLRIREEGAAMTADAKSSNADLTLQIETLKSQEKLLKAKVRILFIPVSYRSFVVIVSV